MTSLTKLLTFQFILSLIFFTGVSASLILIINSFENDFFVKNNVLILPFGFMIIFTIISFILSVIHVSNVYVGKCKSNGYNSVQKPRKSSDSVQIMFLLASYMLFIINLDLVMTSDDITPPSPFGWGVVWVFSTSCIYQFLTFLVGLKIFFDIRKTLIPNNQETISLVG